MTANANKNNAIHPYLQHCAGCNEPFIAADYRPRTTMLGRFHHECWLVWYDEFDPTYSRTLPGE